MAGEVQARTFRQPGVLHRAGITVADKLGVPVLTGPTSQHSVFFAGLTNTTTYQVAVVAGNRYGVSVPSNIVSILTGAGANDYAVIVTCSQVLGAEYYDVFCSTDVQPRWVARITEAQRAAGVTIMPPGSAGTVSFTFFGNVAIMVVGTGLQTSDASFLQNTAFVPADPSISPVVTVGRMELRVLVKATLTGFALVPTLVLIPWLKNQATGEWYAGPLMTVPLLTAPGNTLLREFDLGVMGAIAANILVDTITGCSVDIYCETV